MIHDLTTPSSTLANQSITTTQLCTQTQRVHTQQVHTQCLHAWLGSLCLSSRCNRAGPVVHIKSSVTAGMTRDDGKPASNQEPMEPYQQLRQPAGAGSACEEVKGPSQARA
ncbi:hypothetical protein EKO04_010370 [Ascochyta lentis]|uniref:Uncharacterized protein n=1 Tax=Ascochyta lentis TaxID=205686 RepID=A0A8H7IV33_9PLEO|nr:hypothetical protein EKO04_010370 [Ascochyta lentis]